MSARRPSVFVSLNNMGSVEGYSCVYPVGSAVFVDAVSSAKNRKVMFSISLV
ncbi:hypothetical protein H113_06002 [Trichophyton rubrum MR1459]|nr:hypothetical protein H113_06002 [Trichophyton rubrum MR1459]